MDAHQSRLHFVRNEVLHFAKHALNHSIVNNEPFRKLDFDSISKRFLFLIGVANGANQSERGIVLESASSLRKRLMCAVLPR